MWRVFQFAICYGVMFVAFWFVSLCAYHPLVLERNLNLFSLTEQLDSMIVYWITMIK